MVKRQETSWTNEDGDIFYIDYYWTKYYPAIQGKQPEEPSEIIITSFTNDKGEEIEEVPDRVYYHIEQQQ